MEYWSRRSKRIARLLWVVNLAIATGALAFLAWMLSSTITGGDERSRFVTIPLLCMPLPYMLIYLMGGKGRPSPIRRRRAARKLRESPPDAAASARAKLAWDLLPFKRRLYAGGLSASLAPSGDRGWSKLEEANRDARLATGASFTIPVLLDGGALNFLSGELRDIGTWIAAPAGLVEAMDHEELTSSLIHELFHGETGELKARGIAFSLYDVGLFSTAFLVYYLAFALVINSLPTQLLLPRLSVFALLILLFWSAVKLFAHWAVFGLFTDASCLAADDYAGRVHADPRVVARAIFVSLDYSARHAEVKSLLSGQPYALSRFMFAPLRRGERGKRSLVERVEALRAGSPSTRGGILPKVEEMNREIDAVAADTAASYEALLGKRPGSWQAVLLYALVLGMVLGFMAFATGKNFLPVRWYLDTFEGSPNAAVAGPSATGTTITIHETWSDDGISGFYSNPSSVDIDVGETVTWLNESEREIVISGDRFPASPPLRPGESYSVAFNRSGSYRFHCEGDGGSASHPGYVYASY